MKKIKSIKKLVNLTLIGGGVLVSLPLIVSSCSCGKQTPIQHENEIILTDGTVVKIIDPDGLMVLGSMSDDRLDNIPYTSEPIASVDLIKEIYITPDQTITHAPTNYGDSLCANMSYLTKTDIQIPHGIESTFSDFCREMFNECISLTSFSSEFNLPPNLTSPGGSFCRGMFNGCTSLTSLPNGFNLPQGISGIQAGNFCATMFQNCTSLTSLPINFNLPQGVSSSAQQGSSFCHSMFKNVVI
jgi:hypothetical protein